MDDEDGFNEIVEHIKTKAELTMAYRTIGELAKALQVYADVRHHTAENALLEHAQQIEKAKDV